MRLKCTDLSISFPRQSPPVLALDSINLATGHGEFVSIVGKSGCGKTTLLRAIAGLLPPTSGTISREPSLEDHNDDCLLVFQHDGLFPWMTVLENAAFGLEMLGVPRPEREQRARQMLESFGIAGRESAWPAELSLGMRQRVALARAFLRKPALLLLDEPFAALDAQTRLELQEELLVLWQPSPMSVLFVTHDIDEAILLSDRIVILTPGGAVLDELAVPLPRPRSSDVLTTPEFAAIKRKIQHRLRPAQWVASLA